MTTPRSVTEDVTRRSKWSLMVLACAWVILGFGTASLPWLQWPWLWATFYFGAAVASAICAVKFDSKLAAAHAGASAIVANVMRGAVLIYSRVIDQPATLSWTSGQMVVGVVLPWTLAFAMWVLFFQRVASLGTLERVRK